MFCPNCGTQLPDGSQFCANCGNSLSAPESQQPQTPVWPETPQQPPVAPVIPEVPPMPVPPAKPRKKSKLPVVILALVLVIAVVAALWFFVFNAKETVYLVESHEVVNYSNGEVVYQNSYECEYDELGKILSYRYDYEYSNSYSFSYEIGYEYNEDNLLETAEAKSGDTSIEYEYTFSDKGILEEIVGKAKDGTKIKAFCDDDGRIESVKTYDADGEVVKEVTYEYDDEGNLEEKKQVIHNYTYLYTYENNNLVEQVVKDENEVRYRYVYSYNDKGHVTEEKTYGVGNELMTSLEYEYTYEKDKLVELVIRFEDSEGESTEVVGEVEWDDLEATIELTADDDDTDLELSNAVIELEYDEHGNLLSIEISADGETVMKYTYSYVEVKVPKDYVKFWTGDPIWMTNG